MQEKKPINNKNNNKANRSIVSNNGISYINLIAMGTNCEEKNLPQLIVSTISANNCNIFNITITTLGQDFTLNALINGKWNEIIKLEKYFAVLSKKYSIHLYSKRNNSFDSTESSSAKTPYMNYVAQATTINRPGILDKLLQFLILEKIEIQQVTIKQYDNNIHLIDLKIQIKIPLNLHIVSLREKFLSYCDVLNLDSSLEPLL